MSLGGRPKEEGGHTPLKISVNKFVSEALEKVDNKSKFLEKAVKPLLEQLDPGPACDVIKQIDQQLRTEITRALETKDYAKIQTLSNLAYILRDHRSLCELPNPTSVIAQENLNLPSQPMPQLDGEEPIDHDKIHEPQRMESVNRPKQEAENPLEEFELARHPRGGFILVRKPIRTLLKERPICTWLENRPTSVLKEPFLAKVGRH